MQFEWNVKTSITKTKIYYILFRKIILVCQIFLFIQYYLEKSSENYKSLTCILGTNLLKFHLWIENFRQKWYLKMQSKILLKDAENQFPNHRCKTHKVGAFFVLGIYVLLLKQLPWNKILCSTLVDKNVVQFSWNERE